jgi:hypothetical protein
MTIEGPASPLPKRRPPIPPLDCIPYPSAIPVHSVFTDDDACWARSEWDGAPTNPGYTSLRLWSVAQFGDGVLRRAAHFAEVSIPGYSVPRALWEEFQGDGTAVPPVITYEGKSPPPAWLTHGDLLLVRFAGQGWPSHVGRVLLLVTVEDRDHVALTLVATADGNDALHTDGTPPDPTSAIRFVRHGT